MDTYFVGYDYGMGGIWAHIRTNSVEDIRAVYPDVGTWIGPQFFDDDLLNSICRKHVYELGVVAETMHRALLAAPRRGALSSCNIDRF